MQISDGDGCAGAEGLVHIIEHSYEKPPYPDCPGPQRLPPPAQERPLPEPAGARPTARYEVLPGR